MDKASREPNYPWYGVVKDDSLEQGDFFFALEIYVPNYTGGEIRVGNLVPGEVQLYDVVVLSQSCDLLNRRNLPLSVLVCPVFDLALASVHLPTFADPKVREDARQGKMPGHHMLAQCDLAYFPFGIQVAFFHQILCVPFSYIRTQSGQARPRLRLLPPYREHLAQAFARYVMRVGLPQDIPSLKKNS